MSIVTTAPSTTPTGASYSEIRQHELRKIRMLMIDGNLTLNSRSVDGGVRARVYQDGYWGFASATGADAALAERVSDQARHSVRAMARLGPKATIELPGGRYRGEHVFRGRAALAHGFLRSLLAAQPELVIPVLQVVHRAITRFANATRCWLPRVWRQRSRSAHSNDRNPVDPGGGPPVVS